MKKIVKDHIFWYLLIFVIAFVFFWKFFLKSLIPFPGDLLVGAYYPWLENKWGYAVGVPVKNPLISDVFSQIYLWKLQIADGIKSQTMPLWNPYSYSGYPLLANFQSGVFNPLNFLMVLFDPTIGWGLMMFGQLFLSTVFMYRFIRLLKMKRLSALIGAITYGFSGFSIAWMEFATVGQAMIWLPILFLLIEKTAVSKKRIFLGGLPIIFLFIVGSGHFQALIYAAILSSIYLVYRLKPFSKEGASFLRPAVLMAVFSLGISTVQILPTIELMNRGVRFEEAYIKNVNYGLLPLGNLITLIAPDVFGNATTGNYWGFLNYQETVMYAGVLGAMALVFGLFQFNKLKSAKFFCLTALFALLLAFDNPVGRLIYWLKIPGLSTSAAGRIGMIFVFAIGILTAKMMDMAKDITLKERFKWPTTVFLVLGLTGVIFLITNRLLANNENTNYLLSWVGNTKVGLRNLVIPAGITLAISIIILLIDKFKYWKWIVLGIVVFDLFRFGWKYTPFVPKQIIFPEMESINYLKKETDIFRIERENGPIMPPNTWMAYGLMSPSGYDPMAEADYVRTYNKDLNNDQNPGVSRYSELEQYDAEALGKYNVKYLLALKRNDKKEIPGELLNPKINISDWKKVKETPALAILENTKYKERARVIYDNGDEAEGSVTIVRYENNRVIVRFTNSDGDKLLLTDSYFPGWKAVINGKKTKIGDEIKPFRTVDIKGVKNGEVIFEYIPESFRIGLYISGMSFVAWLFSLFLLKRDEK